MIARTVLFTVFFVGAFAQTLMIKEALKAQCKKNGAEDKMEQIETVVKDFIDCMTKLVDGEVLQTEIEAAKPVGALNEVFKKYCDKSAEFISCIRGLTSGVQPCLEAEIRGYIPAVENTTNQLIDYICYKDGNRLTLFIEEGGPECIQEKRNDINDCAMKLKENIASDESAQNLSRIEKCSNFDEMSACVVKSLETCPTTIAANMVESILKFIRNGSLCKGIKKN